MKFVELRDYIYGPVLTVILIFFNYIILGGIFNLFNYDVNFYNLITVCILIGLIHYVSNSFEKKKTRRITRILFEIDGVWLWCSFMYAFLLIFICLLQLFVDSGYLINLISVLIVPVFGVIGYINAHRYHVRSYNLDLVQKTENLDDVCIIHLSDLHIGSSRPAGTVKNIVESINDVAGRKKAEGIDCITIISGDVADGSCPVLEDDYMAFSDALMPVIFTPGNHDFYRGIDNVENALGKAGVIILDNDTLEFEKYGLNIIGLSFAFDSGNDYEFSLSEDMNNVVVYHVPENWDELSEKGVDLELSGHTHGGQFYPMVWLLKLVFKYNHGLFKNRICDEDDVCHNSYLSVSEGVGTFAAPVRLGTKSEIVLLNINRK